jgi:hypothetical protein
MTANNIEKFVQTMFIAFSVFFSKEIHDEFCHPTHGKSFIRQLFRFFWFYLNIEVEKFFCHFLCEKLNFALDLVEYSGGNIV